MSSANDLSLLAAASGPLVKNNLVESVQVELGAQEHVRAHCDVESHSLIEQDEVLASAHTGGPDDLPLLEVVGSEGLRGHIAVDDDGVVSLDDSDTSKTLVEGTGPEEGDSVVGAHLVHHVVGGEGAHADSL